MTEEDGGRASPPRGLRSWLVVFCACLMLSMGIPIGFATWYVATYAKHSCQALTLITASQPAHPTPAQARFYAALNAWTREDGC